MLVIYKTNALLIVEACSAINNEAPAPYRYYLPLIANADYSNWAVVKGPTRICALSGTMY